MIPFVNHWDGNVLQVVNNLFSPELGIIIGITPHHLGQAEVRCEAGVTLRQ